MIKEELNNIIYEEESLTESPEEMEQHLHNLKKKCESGDDKACMEARKMEDYMFGQGRMMESKKNG